MGAGEATVAIGGQEGGGGSEGTGGEEGGGGFEGTGGEEGGGGFEGTGGGGEVIMAADEGGGGEEGAEAPLRRTLSETCRFSTRRRPFRHRVPTWWID
jgi:hypothetical protein